MRRRICRDCRAWQWQLAERSQVYSRVRAPGPLPEPADPPRRRVGARRRARRDRAAVGRRAQDPLGTIVVDNRGGGGGTIGVSRGRARRPDGYTLLLGSNSTHILVPLISKQAGFDPIKDFELVSVFCDHLDRDRGPPGNAIPHAEGTDRGRQGEPRQALLCACRAGLDQQRRRRNVQAARGRPRHPAGPLQGHGPRADGRGQRYGVDVRAQHHRRGDRTASRRQDPHPRRQRAGATSGSARHPDRDRGRSARHDHPELLRHLCARRNAKADARSQVNEATQTGACRQGLSEAAERRRFDPMARIRARDKSKAYMRDEYLRAGRRSWRRPASGTEHRRLTCRASAECDEPNAPAPPATAAPRCW